MRRERVCKAIRGSPCARVPRTPCHDRCFAAVCRRDLLVPLLLSRHLQLLGFHMEKNKKYKLEEEIGVDAVKAFAQRCGTWGGERKHAAHVRAEWLCVWRVTAAVQKRGCFPLCCLMTRSCRHVSLAA